MVAAEQHDTVELDLGPMAKPRFGDREFPTDVFERSQTCVPGHSPQGDHDAETRKQLEFPFKVRSTVLEFRTSRAVRWRSTPHRRGDVAVP